MVRVFLSYCHDDPEHRGRVHALADRLTGETGISVVLDRDTGPGGPDEGWPRWSERQVREAERVLIACSEHYGIRYEGKDGESDRGRGTVVEARAIQQYLYEAKGQNARFRVVILTPSDVEHIPLQLRGYHYFDPTQSQSYKDLIAWLRGGMRDVDAALPDGPIWPQPDSAFKLPLADRRPHFDSIRSALSGQSSNRIFLLQGDGAAGKTEFLNEIITYAEHVHVPWIRFDFKGAPPIAEFFQEVILQFGGRGLLPNTKGARAEAPLVELVDDLGRLKTPALFLFDTYEKASEEGRIWLESKFLPRLRNLPGVIAIVGGRTVPERTQYPWRTLAEFRTLDPIRNAEDWREYLERVRQGKLEMHEIELLTAATKGSPGNLRPLLDNLLSQPTVRPQRAD